MTTSEIYKKRRLLDSIERTIRRDMYHTFKVFLKDKTGAIPITRQSDYCLTLPIRMVTFTKVRTLAIRMEWAVYENLEVRLVIHLGKRGRFKQIYSERKFLGDHKPWSEIFTNNVLIPEIFNPVTEQSKLWMKTMFNLGLIKRSRPKSKGSAIFTR